MGSGLDPLMQETFFEILKEENEKGSIILFSLQSVYELRDSTYKRIQLRTKDPISEQKFSLDGDSE